MSDVFTLTRGDGPLLVSFPHSGTRLAPGLEDRLSPAGQGLPDTDWCVPALYDFLDRRRVSVIQAQHSRYVVDLNRPVDGQRLYPGQQETGLCPVTTFDGEPLYRPGEQPGDAERRDRAARYWHPYHDALAEELARIRQRHGVALLWDAHSIRAEVPRLFEGRLPDFNFGTNDDRSCPRSAVEPLHRLLVEGAAFTSVINGRFQGGYITRHYGDPDRCVYALQLELSQRTHLDAATRALDPPQATVTADTLRRLMAVWEQQVLGLA